MKRRALVRSLTHALNLTGPSSNVRNLSTFSLYSSFLPVVYSLLGSVTHTRWCYFWQILRLGSGQPQFTKHPYLWSSLTTRLGPRFWMLNCFKIIIASEYYFCQRVQEFLPISHFRPKLASCQSGYTAHQMSIWLNSVWGGLVGNFIYLLKSGYHGEFVPCKCLHIS